MKKGILATLICIAMVVGGWFTYKAVYNHNEPQMEVMASSPSSGWFQRVETLETQIATLQQKVAEGDLYIQNVNSTLKKYVFYIYGTFSEDPQENLAKLEKWVLDIRAETKHTKERLTAVEGIDEQVILVAEQVQGLEKRVTMLEESPPK